MKKLITYLSLFAALGLPMLAFAASTEEVPPAQPNTHPSYPASVNVDEKNESGWFIGSDQGVLIFTGNSGNFLDPQYYSTVFGGYNIKGYIQPILSIGQAIGGTTGFFNTTTFFFLMEGGVRITPIRTKVRPYFIGTAGFYVLDFSNFGFPVFNDTNFTFQTGGGIEAKFGTSRLTLGSAYRGFTNQGINLHSVEVTLGYIFQF